MRFRTLNQLPINGVGHKGTVWIAHVNVCEEKRTARRQEITIEALQDVLEQTIWDVVEQAAGDDEVERLLMSH